MKYLRFNPEYRTTTPVECFLFKGEYHPTKNGCDDKKTFIYGEGYVTVSKKAKRFMVDPLPENYTTSDIMKVYKEYGVHMTLRMIAERYSPNDCCYSGYSFELRNVIKYGESYDAFLQLAYDIDNACLSILKEKYGVFIKYNDLHFGDPDGYNPIPAYYINEFTGRTSTTTRFSHYFSGNLDLSIMGLCGMDAHYNPISHEVNLKSMIRQLSTVFPLFGGRMTLTMKPIVLNWKQDCRTHR